MFPNSVIFVHGFTGSPYKTWTRPRGTADHLNERTDGLPSTKIPRIQAPFRSHAQSDTETKGIFWPRDLLPTTLPNARILTHGYDTHLRHKIIGRPLSKMGVYDIANDLLVSLEAKRREDPSRPILFVCHSLGGIVVKDMLRQACHCQDQDLQRAFNSTVGIIFFGTPHLGADPQKLLRQIADKLARLAGFAINQEILNTLLPNSERLRQLRDEFRPIPERQNWKIYSFQEALGVSALGGAQVGTLFPWATPAADGGFRLLTTRPLISILRHLRQPSTSTVTTWKCADSKAWRTLSIRRWQPHF